MTNKKVIILFIIIFTLLTTITACNQDKTIEEYTITIKQPDEGGTIEVEPDQDKYEAETKVKITANPDDNWEFIKWTSGLEGTDKEVKFPLEKDFVIEAKFEEESAEEDTEKITGHVTLLNRGVNSDNDSTLPFSTNSFYSPAKAETKEYITDEIIVKFNNPNKKEEILEKRNLSSKRNSAFGTEILTGIDKRDIKQVINNLNKNSNIAYAEKNTIFHKSITKTEPENASAYYDEQQEDYSLISLPYAWSLSTGDEEVTVAVLDTGIDSNHPDLKPNLIQGKNFTDDEPNTETDDKDGHGTHVAGTVGAADNEKVVGSSWEVSLMPVKVLGDDGSGSLADVAEGIEWAIDNGADILNLSLGTSNDSKTLKEAVEAANDKGVTVIASAGNDGKDEVFYPAAYETVIAIGSINNKLEKSSFSNYGENLDFMAPGEQIYSTVPEGEHGPKSGTSMAAPHVSGIAALMLSQKDLTPNELKEELKATAQDLGEDLGKDYEFGYGLVNSHAGVAKASTKAELKVFAGEKDEENNTIYKKSPFINSDLEGFYALEKLSDEYYIYAWLDLSANGQIASGDYFGRSEETVKKSSEVNFTLDLITDEDDFAAIDIE